MRSLYRRRLFAGDSPASTYALANSIINVSFPLAYYALITVAAAFSGYLLRRGGSRPRYCCTCGATNGVAYMHGYAQFIDWLKKL